MRDERLLIANLSTEETKKDAKEISAVKRKGRVS